MGVLRKMKISIFCKISDISTDRLIDILEGDEAKVVLINFFGAKQVIRGVVRDYSASNT